MEGPKYDIKLVTPALLFSKILIFNWKGGPQQDTMLDMLGVLANAAESIKLPGEDGSGGGAAAAGGSEGENIFGHLHIVFR